MTDPADILGTRRTCSRCRNRRRVNAVWLDTGHVLCKECSRTPDVAFIYSRRNPMVVAARQRRLVIGSGAS